MKIVEVIPQLVQGGAEKFVVDLCNELSMTNEVTLVVLLNLDKYGYFLKDISNKVNIISIEKKEGIDFKALFKLRSVIKSIKPDVVHTHLRGLFYILASLDISSVKFVHTLHSLADKEAGDKLGTFIRKFVFHFKLIIPITISDAAYDSFTNFYGLPSHTIYNGSTSYTNPSEAKMLATKNELLNRKINKDSLIVLNIARIQPEKNQITMCKAVDNLNKKGYKIELGIIGDNSNIELVKEIEEIKSPFIHILGPKHNPRDFLTVADAFCLCSFYEGMPLSLIECFSVGVIPICTPVGGVNDMIQDGENGLLSEGVSQKDIENVLVRFYNLSQDERNVMKKKSFQSFYKYSINTCARNYERYFKCILTQ